MPTTASALRRCWRTASRALVIAVELVQEVLQLGEFFLRCVSGPEVCGEHGLARGVNGLEVGPVQSSRLKPIWALLLHEGRRLREWRVAPSLHYRTHEDTHSDKRVRHSPELRSPASGSGGHVAFDSTQQPTG